jgi:hypothetical protein
MLAAMQGRGSSISQGVFSLVVASVMRSLRRRCQLLLTVSVFDDSHFL